MSLQADPKNSTQQNSTNATSHRSTLRTAARAGLFASLFAFTCWLSLWPLPAEAKAKAGQSFPALKVAPFPGKAPLNAKALQGKVVIYDFWAAWCEPCKVELPALEKLYQKYKGKGLVVVGVNVDDDANDGKAFLQDHPVSFPVVYDKNKSMVEGLGVETMPTSFIVDRTGKIHRVHAGFKSGDEKKLEKEIIELLK
ncbi:MAG TPA: redoxin family protein [Pseudobdellovibrionaceae bacterium]|nr:redoxin family protein [Pseudobdellovibrionaceae bacterium]